MSKKKPKEALAIVEQKPAEIERTASDRIRDVEDELLERSLGQISDGLAWNELDLGAAKPDGWSEAKYRTVIAAQMSAKEAPYGLRLAKDVAMGIVKARATEKAAPRALNIEVAHIDFTLPDFPKLKVPR